MECCGHIDEPCSNCPLVRVEQKSVKHRKPYIRSRLNSGTACHPFAMFALRSRASHRVIELLVVTQLGNSTSTKALCMVYLTASFPLCTPTCNGFIYPSPSELKTHKLIICYSVLRRHSAELHTVADNVQSRP